MNPKKQAQKNHSAFEISNLSSIFKKSGAIFLSPNHRHELSYPAKFQKTIEKSCVFFLRNYYGKSANLLNFLPTRDALMVWISQQNLEKSSNFVKNLPSHPRTNDISPLQPRNELSNPPQFQNSIEK